MSIEVIYRVLKANGELAGEYMDRKLAEAHDLKLDCIDAISELIGEAANGLDAKVIEGIAEHLVNNKQAIMSALKKIKDVVADESQSKDPSSPRAPDSKADSNVESITKKLANG